MTISLSSYSTGTVAVEQGSTTVVLSGAGAAWPSSWCKPGCQFAIAGEAQTNFVAAWTDDHTVELALPVARATEADLTYSILITAPAFGTNLEAALTNIERIRLMSENMEIGDLLAVATAAAIWPAHDDLLAIWDKGDEFKIKPTTVNLLYRLLGSVMAKAADYTIEAKDIGQLVAVSAGGAARIIGLPSAAAVGAGFTTGIKKIDTSANTVTIAAAGGDTIDGAATVNLSARFDVVWLRSDGANWHVTGDLRRVAEGVHYDAAVETDDAGDLAPYDDKPGPTATEPGFAVLIGNIGGTGRAGIKWKLSDNSADWSDPAYLAPAIDIAAAPVNVVDFGTDPSATLTSDGAGGYTLSLSLPSAADLKGITVTTLAPGSEATGTLTPTVGGYILELGLPQGATGTISGLTPFWQDIVTTKEDAPTSRAALEIAFASQAEAEAGTDATKYMNPLATKQAIAKLVDLSAVASDVVPDADSTRDLGSAAKAWAEAYADKVLTGQVAFPATQNPSAGANTLDDYREATYTPVVFGSATAGVGTYSVQRGSYTKIGRHVSGFCEVAWSAHTGTGNLYVTLPFQPQDTNVPIAIFPVSLAYTVNNQIGAQTDAGGGGAQIVQWPMGGAGASGVPMDTAATIRLQFDYDVA